MRSRHGAIGFAPWLKDRRTSAWSGGITSNAGRLEKYPIAAPKAT